MLSSSMRDLTREMAPDTHQSFFDTTLCAYTTSPYLNHYLACNYTWQKKLMYLMTACYTSNNGFTANDALFYNNKVG